jgi:hypothetical protein
MRLAASVIAVALLAAGDHPVPPPAEHGSAPSHLLRASEFFHKGTKEADNSGLARGHYRLAARHYQRVLDEGYDNPLLFWNLGNAHVLADDLPEAILAYRRGLRKYPHERWLSEQLDAARDLVAYPGGTPRQRPPSPDLPMWMLSLGSGCVFYALSFLATAWGFLGLWLLVRRRLFAILAIGLFLLGGTAGAWWVYVDYRYAQDEHQPFVVVAVNGVTLRRGNGSMYPRHSDLPVVNRGMEARLLHQRGGWVQLQFPGGEVGWVPRATLLVDDTRR